MKRSALILILVSALWMAVTFVVPQDAFAIPIPTVQFRVGLLMVGLTMSFFSMVMTQHISQLPDWLMGLMHTMKQ